MLKRLLILVLFIQTSSFAQSYAKMFEQYQKEAGAENTAPARKTAIAILNDTKFQKDLDKNPVQKAELLNAYGNELYMQNQFEPALEKYSQATELIKNTLGDTSLDYGIYGVNMAAILNTLGKYAVAEQWYLVSLPILAKGLGQNSPEYVMFYTGYVEMKIEMGDYLTAKPYNDGLLYYYKTMYGEKNKHYLRCLNASAQIYMGQGNNSKALEIFEQLIEIQKNIIPLDTSNYATILNNTAEAYRHVAQYNRAEELYLQAYNLDISKINTDPAGLASLLNNMALMYKAKGNYNEAEKCFLKSIELYKIAGMAKTPDITNPLNNLGDLYRITGRYKQAYETLSEALDIRAATSGENHENYANALSNLALVYYNWGYLADAENLFAKCSEIYRIRLGEHHQMYANSLNNEAMAFIPQKKYKEAEAYKLKALDIIKKAEGDSSDRYALYLTGMTDLYTETGRFDEAIKGLEKAASIFKAKFGEKNYDYIEVMSHLAEVYKFMKNNGKAETYYVQSLNSYQQLFENYFSIMNEDEKTAFYYQVAPRFESFNQFVFQQVKEFPKQNHDKLIEAMYNYRLVTKSLLLNESNNLHQYMLSATDTAVTRIYSYWLERKQYLNAQYRLSKEQLAANNINIDALEKEVNKLEKELNSRSADFNKSNVSKNNTWLDIQKKMKPAEAAVEIVRTEFWITDSTASVSYGALILDQKSKEPKLTLLSNGNELDKDYLKDYSKNIEQKKTDNESYKRYWSPISASLPGIKKVYFSADGAYQQLNLYTLKNPANANYLIDEISVQLLTNTKDLLKPDDRTAVSNTAQLFGYPDYEYDFATKKESKRDTTIQLAQKPKNENPAEYKDAVVFSRSGFSDLPPLPGTKQEVDDINNVLKSAGWQVNELIKENASEEAIKKVNSPKILHIATHGFFLPNEDLKGEKTIGFDTEKARQNPLLRSGIMLAGVSVVARSTEVGKYAEDGVLTAYEASLLNLQGTELVVLSACETGLGEVSNGQGVYGLQRAFMIAGAKTMVMSLWTVDDNATQELMTAFYTEWAKDPRPENKLIAFRKAQLKIKEKYKDPYFWGAFVMIGT